MAKDSPLPDCPLQETDAIATGPISSDMTPTLQVPGVTKPLPPPTTVQATNKNQTTEHNPTIIQDLTFCNQELSFPSFNESTNCPLISIDDSPIHTSTPSLSNQIPSRKYNFDFIDRLKAAITDDTDDAGLAEDNHLKNTLEQFTKTQELLVRSINNLAKQQSILLEKMDTIIQLRPVCQPPVPSLQSSVVAHEQPTSNPKQLTLTPEQPKEMNSEQVDETSQLTDSIYQLLEKKFSLPKDEIFRLSRKSCSEGNFAVKLLQLIFTKDQLVGRNCNGKRGKLPLEKLKLEVIKQAVSKVYSLNQASKEEVWKKCVVAMDEFLRRK